jgi:hypothetical protein
VQTLASGLVAGVCCAWIVVVAVLCMAFTQASDLVHVAVCAPVFVWLLALDLHVSALVVFAPVYRVWMVVITVFGSIDAHAIARSAFICKACVVLAHFRSVNAPAGVWLAPIARAPVFVVAILGVADPLASIFDQMALNAWRVLWLWDERVDALVFGRVACVDCRRAAIAAVAGNPTAGTSPWVAHGLRARSIGALCRIVMALASVMVTGVECAQIVVGAVLDVNVGAFPSSFIAHDGHAHVRGLAHDADIVALPLLRAVGDERHACSDNTQIVVIVAVALVVTALVGICKSVDRARIEVVATLFVMFADVTVDTFANTMIICMRIVIVAVHWCVVAPASICRAVVFGAGVVVVAHNLLVDALPDCLVTTVYRAFVRVVATYRACYAAQTRVARDVFVATVLQERADNRLVHNDNHAVTDNNVIICARVAVVEIWYP